MSYVRSKDKHFMEKSIQKEKESKETGTWRDKKRRKRKLKEK